MFFEGNEVKEGWIDAMSFSASKEIPDYVFFVFKQNDASLFMNKDGF